MALHTFRIGDILKPDDELSLFIANVSMAFNDLVFTNVEMDRLKNRGSGSTVQDWLSRI